jgi:hypothetical protein
MKTYLTSELKQVPEADRVKGRVYGVSDLINEGLEYVAIFKTGNNSIIDYTWNYWFELPESLLPVRDVLVMPEVGKEYEFSDNKGASWSRNNLNAFIAGGDYYDNIRPVPELPKLPELTIPAGTKGEQLEYLRGVIATFEGGGV